LHGIYTISEAPICFYYILKTYQYVYNKVNLTPLERSEWTSDSYLLSCVEIYQHDRFTAVSLI